MSNADIIPELKQIVGALIFGSDRVVTIKEIRGCLVEVAKTGVDGTAPFAKVKDSDIEAAVGELKQDLKSRHMGFFLAEVAGGYKLQSDPVCGKWLKYFLDAGKPNRISRPALETLAIIAYRQPVTRAEIEGIRGVNIDHVVKSLLEMQLLRIVGRSELPGRPFLYGTSHIFLEHFGLKDLKSLDEMGPLLSARFGQLRKNGVSEDSAGTEEQNAGCGNEENKSEKTESSEIEQAQAEN